MQANRKVGEAGQGEKRIVRHSYMRRMVEGPEKDKYVGGGREVLQNLSILPQHYTTSQPKIPQLESYLA
jgi:hypothetical protein